MPSNNEKPNISLEQAEKKQGLTEKIARSAIGAFNSTVTKLGLKGIDIDSAINGIKAGTIVPGELLGWAEEATKLLAQGAKAISVSKKLLKKLPVFGPWLAEAAKWAGKALSISSHVIDRIKDACTDLAISSLSLKVGEAQKGVDDVNNKVDAQGKAMSNGFNNLSGKMDGVKSDLEGQISAQGAELRGEMAAQGAEINNLKSTTNRLDSAINNLSQAHHEFKAEVQTQFSEVNERIDNTDIKVTKNARDILEERLEREAIDNELRDKIKVNKIQLNSLKEEQEELREDFHSYQTKTDRKLNEIHSEIEDTQEEFSQQLKIQETKIKLELEETQAEFESTKINQTQEILEEYEEAVENVKHDQKRLNVEFQELTDDVETQFDLIHQQTRKLDLVADQMNEITEETNRRMNKLESTIFDIEEQAEEALSMAKRATRQVNKLTEELQKDRQRINKLDEQIQQNREETKQAKAEAQRANERIDNLIKTQQLTDFTKQELAFNKLEKTLQLKAEETKLLAQLNILKETQKLIPEQPTEREWKVGIQAGTAR